MVRKNFTEVDFTLAGLSYNHTIQSFLFLIFLLLYLMSLGGNITITTTIWMNQQLHKPMYFFLGNLSFLDVCYSSVTVPKMLVSLHGGNNEISYRGCMTQLYFYVSCCSTECLLLSIMGFDRYVAICNPMHYSTIMSKRTCLQLAISLWLTGFITSIVHTVFTARLPYCGSHMISHFFCDIPPMLKLACSDTFLNQILILTAGGFLGLSSFVLTLVSYIQIISSILKIRTKVGRSRAFSTCASHLTVVILFFGSISFMYMRPTSSYSLDQDQIVSLLYAVVTPALNPIIYTLRNKEVKAALKKTITRTKSYAEYHGSLSFIGPILDIPGPLHPLEDHFAGKLLNEEHFSEPGELPRQMQLHVFTIFQGSSAAEDLLSCPYYCLKTLRFRKLRDFLNRFLDLHPIFIPDDLELVKSPISST
ncbi:olfactory receptor 5V1-like [Bombina bombina]|uniref:olfactory receptor 5V1-like n=1 Tax=Bombina bombina TaxID=8345 RepID=UPI00235AEC29|nr:olfactory receptor 5V1-like [Bombina bombina]